MNRTEVIEDMIAKGVKLLEMMEKKLIDRVDADSRYNGIGKILKGVQLHIVDEELAHTRSKMIEHTGRVVLKHKPDGSYSVTKIGQSDSSG